MGDALLCSFDSPDGFARGPRLSAVLADVSTQPAVESEERVSHRELGHGAVRQHCGESEAQTRAASPAAVQGNLVQVRRQSWQEMGGPVSALDELKVDKSRMQEAQADRTGALGALEEPEVASVAAGNLLSALEKSSAENGLALVQAAPDEGDGSMMSPEEEGLRGLVEEGPGVLVEEEGLGGSEEEADHKGDGGELHVVGCSAEEDDPETLGCLPAAQSDEAHARRQTEPVEAQQVVEATEIVRKVKAERGGLGGLQGADCA